MILKNRLFTPGPTQLLPAAQLAMAAATMHHRTAEFRKLYAKVLADLKIFVGTKNDVVLFTASGTGAMEAAVSNLTSPGDKVLVVSAGKFGERWESLVKAYGCQVETVRAEYGDTVTVEQVKAKLKPEHAVLYMQGTESSTGARHNVEGIAKLLKSTSTLLVVDAITGLGTTAFDVDGWGIDIIIGGSQKAVMIPPGLAYCAVSPRAWQRMETTKNPRYYFDLRKENKNGAKGESSYTPSTALVAALSTALDYLREQGGGDLAAGRDLLIRNAETAAAMTRAAAHALGLKLFSPGSPGAALTAIATPEGIDSGDIAKAFRNNFGAVIANGQGEMKGQLFRIAHLGFYDYLDTISIIGALEQVLAGLGRKVEFGAGLRAAQTAYSQSIARREEFAISNF
ncbi:MAG TPA: alanine--glyoxylate aminotransferase family protein [Candidatus Angelobacter sp.]|jgi:aspartate aminotransferase-like enzyme|nr:alanine--glyoxylate aminotransferase family protein [Candidatus Angelobacter sp.]